MGTAAEYETGDGRRRWWQREWVRATGALFVVASLALVVAAEYALRNAEPILRRRILETLSARFDAPAELDRLQISLFKGIEVEGWGLRVGLGSGVPGAAPQPLIAVRYFAFRTSLRGLLHQPTHVRSVRVEGMELHIPPPSERARLFGRAQDHGTADPEASRGRRTIALLVDSLSCRDVQLFLESDKSVPEGGRKAPIAFKLARLDLQSVGPGQPMQYQAELTNPKPTGLVQVSGHFGPWGGVPGGTVQPATTTQAAAPPDPGRTPLDGDYRLDNADLGTIKGIGGTLASKGHFAGVLDRLVIDGTTDTPDFSLDISEHPVPLHTAFHAIVDGTSGDTYLEPVHARLLGSDFTVSGKVVKGKGLGHDILLDVDIPHGRMQDFLRLAVKTSPPLLDGALTMRARLQIPPGNVRVAEKLAMQGEFHLGGARFSNPRLQGRIDGLSARAQGRPGEVKATGADGTANVQSEMAARFTLAHGVMGLEDVRYAIPGATVLLTGVYSMDGKLFELKGHVRTVATASEMVGGWKGLLLQPVDRFLQKNGAGVELPIEISGTQGDVHMGLAMHGTDQTPGQMLTEVHEKQRKKQELNDARKEAALADAEDREAAQATTLEEAERAHNAAVRHREEARRKAEAAQQGPS